MNTKAKVALVVLIAGLIGLFFFLDGTRYLNLAYLQEIRGTAAAYVEANPVTSSLAYFGLYVAITALSIPGAAAMTLAGGAVFGFAWGFVLVSFASTSGATLAMLVSRTVLRDWVEKRFAGNLEVVHKGLAADGPYYLFGLRMVPLIPFFAINLMMGLTRISVWQFYWVSQLGMLGGTVVYVFAGSQLAGVDNVGDIMNPGLIVAFSLIGLFPLLARKGLAWVRRSKSLRTQANG
jgi:uncharacterized membrane protein YdjX (TVP38/TMEM64 family)